MPTPKKAPAKPRIVGVRQTRVDLGVAPDDIARMEDEDATRPPVSVLVPWRETPDRAPLWAYLRAKWTSTFPNWEIIEGSCPDGPWRKGLAVADALTRARGDVLVVADADVWTDGVAEAVSTNSPSCTVFSTIWPSTW